MLTIRRARRRGLLRLQKADRPMRLDCPGGECGLCCEILGERVVVSSEEGMAIGEERLVRQGADVFLRSERGVCSCLLEKSCSIYDRRPQGCREYPWYRIDDELFVDVGCPGIRTDRDERPEVAAIRPVQFYLAGIPNFLRSCVLRWLRRGVR